MRIEPSDLEFGGQVGSGGCAKVYKGRWKSQGLVVAIKTVSSDFREEEVRERFIMHIFKSFSLDIHRLG